MNKEIEKIKNAQNVMIYGAGVMARALYACIKDIVNITCFMVSDKRDNVESIEGIPVLCIQEGEKSQRTMLILVAVIDKYRGEISELLESTGYEHILYVTFESRLWEDIREAYIREAFRKAGRYYWNIDGRMNMPVKKSCSGIHIYQVKSHMDKEIFSGAGYNWEIPIQAGAQLTDQYIASVKDNTGENISYKNKEYCELTALYWIWKNDHSEWKGLCHYRRHFDLDREMLGMVKESDIDVILTIPILNFPDVRYMYIHDHVKRDWEIMLAAVRKLQPLYEETAEQVQKGQFYYGYNMLIARAEIFDGYCTWLFPILEYCEKHCKKKEDRYQGRYIGFLAERLMSIYFLHHWKDYRIVHCSKVFLEENFHGG